MPAAGYDPTQLADQWKRRTQREELALIMNANQRPLSGMSDNIVEMDLTKLLGFGLDRADSRPESLRSVSALDKASSAGGGSRKSSNASVLKARIQTEQKKRLEAEAEADRLRALLAEKELKDSVK